MVVFLILADVAVIINSTLVAIINNLHHICTTSFHAENGVLFNFHLMTIIFYIHALCENFCNKLKKFLKICVTGHKALGMNLAFVCAPMINNHVDRKKYFHLTRFINFRRWVFFILFEWKRNEVQTLIKGNSRLFYAKICTWKFMQKYAFENLFKSMHFKVFII